MLALTWGGGKHAGGGVYGKVHDNDIKQIESLLSTDNENIVAANPSRLLSFSSHLQIYH